jgi:peptidoglycan/xylan/chitin deacetylase (PgdA/CDA1 family)
MTNPRIPFMLSSQRPALAPPGGKPLIVHVEVALETWPFDAPMPRAVLPAPHGKVPKPDVVNFSWVEYGLRCGLPRLIRILGERGIRAGNIMNAGLIEDYPACAEAARQAGWEFIAHGVVQRTLQDEPDEAAAINQTAARIEAFTGTRPRGWIGPGMAETTETPDHLKAAGFDYTMDWMVDDLPCWMETAHGPLLAVPYALDLNDVTIFAVERHTADEYVRRYTDVLAALEPELAQAPRVLTVVAHPHVMAVPHRIGAFARVLDMIGERDDAQFLTPGAIADWYTDAVPPPASPGLGSGTRSLLE